MWSLLTGLCTVVGGLLGLLTTTNPNLVQPPLKGIFIGAFLLVVIGGAFSTWMDQRESSQQFEDAMRQITGRGGYPTISVLGLMPIKGQVVDGRVIAHFQVLNHSDVPVFDCRIQISQLVGVPHGFMGTDMLILPTVSVSAVHPHNAPQAFLARPVLRMEGPNIFTAVIFSRSATFTQRIVTVWKDGAWHTDTDVVQQADADRNNEETVFRTMKPEFRQLLPAAWQ